MSQIFVVQSVIVSDGRVYPEPIHLCENNKIEVDEKLIFKVLNVFDFHGISFTSCRNINDIFVSSFCFTILTTTQRDIFNKAEIGIHQEAKL